MMQNLDNLVVSVCIQTYQHADYIKQCIDSVLAQETRFPFEIILGEDDSTDGTRKICIEYSKKYPETISLYLRSEKDKVYINGRKTGRFNYIENLKVAKGKYIALLDGDDFWTDKLKLQKQVEFMEANEDCSLSFHKIECLKNGGYPDPFVYTEIHEKDGKFTINDFMDEKIPTPVSVMIRSSCVKDLPSWLWKVPFIDYPLYFHCAQQGSVGLLSRKMGVYRIHPGGLWSSKNYEDALTAIWQQFSIMASYINGPLQKILLAKRLDIGLSLIYFYKTHAWQKKAWLKKELQQNKFLDDKELLLKLEAPSNLKTYWLNGWNFSKFIVKRVIKRA